MAATTPPRKSVSATSARTRARTRPAESTSLLGDGFAVGVATSGYQVEGGFNGDGEPQNNWSAWEGAGRTARSGLACDFWRHPEEALDRAAAIGCNAFRLSVEWARFGIRLVAVAIGQFDTETLRTKYPQAIVDNVAGTVPLGRLALPQDIANAALFLASADAEFVTGNVVEVDGGRSV